MKAHPKVTVQAVQIPLGWGVGPQGIAYVPCFNELNLKKTAPTIGQKVALLLEAQGSMESTSVRAL